MKQIIFKPEQIPEDLREAVFEVAIPINEEYSLLEEKVLYKVMQKAKTKWRIKDFETVSGDFEGCHFVNFTDVKPTAEWKSYSYEGRNEKSFMSLVNSTIVALFGDTWIFDCQYESFNPEFYLAGDGFNKFFLVIAGQSVIRKSRMNLESAYGTHVDNYTLTLLMPSGKGIPIVDPESGLCLAELCEDKFLYIHARLIYGKSDHLILKKIFEQVKAIKAYTDTELTQYLNNCRTLQTERYRNQYVEACSNIKSVKLAQLQRELEQINKQIEDYQTGIVKYIRQYRQTESMIQGLESNYAFKNERYAEEFDKILTIPQVKSIMVDEHNLNIFTYGLYCPDEGTIYDIGEFRIEIPYTGKGNVRWHNLTRQIQAYEGRSCQAPHVFTDGSACLGTLKEAMPELIANCEYFALTTLAINFIESVNTSDSAGKYIYRWPKANTRTLPEYVRL